ncbi:MAG: 5-(carboxyamino)imidazole ribonucleotide synthase [Acidimicrobiales bacterium]
MDPPEGAPSAVVAPPATLGLLGGGQLGRYFVSAAHELGYEVWVLDPDSDSPAGRIADRHLVAAYDDRPSLDLLAERCQAVTTEFENIPAKALAHLATTTMVRPSAEAVALCQDRLAEKAFLAEHGLPCGAFAVVRHEDDLRAADAALFPGILKVARFGYDGKGQAVVAGRDEAIATFARSGSEPSVLEQRLDLDRELSVVLARGMAGEVRCFPVAENRHTDGILDTSIVPARAHEAVLAEAVSLATRIATGLGYVGTMAVELFVSGGRLLVNEVAPRPHNSGHVTLDSCATDQFEQQVRALCSLPLLDPTPRSAGVMVNLLGDLWGPYGTAEPDWTALLAHPGLRLHLYGKREARPGRKMGHFTVVDDDVERALDVALAARAALGIRQT